MQRSHTHTQCLLTFSTNFSRFRFWRCRGEQVQILRLRPEVGVYWWTKRAGNRSGILSWKANAFIVDSWHHHFVMASTDLFSPLKALWMPSGWVNRESTYQVMARSEVQSTELLSLGAKNRTAEQNVRCEDNPVILLYRKVSISFNTTILVGLGAYLLLRGECEWV